MQPRYSLVIRGGTIADGTGADLRVADIAIDAGRIVAIGDIAQAGQEEIDATGLLVTPGFIDIHTHYDGQATWEQRLTPSSWHGITTVVMGNCGVGFAPAKATSADHDWLIGLLEGVEDIPGTALAEGLTWDWETFPEYLDSVARRPHAIDIVAQIPHAPLRAYVMGRDRAITGEATDQDVADVLTYVRQSFGNQGNPVTADQVKALRGEVGQPQITVEELVKP